MKMEKASKTRNNRYVTTKRLQIKKDSEPIATSTAY